jgi:hypothetical protein
MWEPRPLTTLWAFTVCYRDSFTFLCMKSHNCTHDATWVLFIAVHGTEMCNWCLRGGRLVCLVFVDVLIFSRQMLHKRQSHFTVIQKAHSCFNLTLHYICVQWRFRVRRNLRSGREEKVSAGKLEGKCCKTYAWIRG